MLTTTLAYQTLVCVGARDERQTAVSCSWCGTTADPAPVTWTVQTSARGIEYLCETCTRDNVRKIEGSLPTEYW
jgi:hypothetical protein